MKSAPPYRACRIPRLTPPAKPRLVPFSISVRRGNAARIRSTESSGEPLSTTITDRFGYRVFARESRQAIVSRQPFQLRMMAAVEGLSNGDTVECALSRESLSAESDQNGGGTA
jgi:hypothetical protein